MPRAVTVGAVLLPSLVWGPGFAAMQECVIDKGSRPPAYLYGQWTFSCPILSFPQAHAARSMRLQRSALSDRFLGMVVDAERCLQLPVCSCSCGIYSSCPIILVLIRLTLRPNVRQAWQNWSMRVRRCSWDCATTAASSPHSLSLMTSLLTFCFGSQTGKF